MSRHSLIVERTTLIAAGLLTLGPALAHAGAVPDTAGIARANNAFAADLYGRFKSGAGNLFFSPYSISLAFGMAGCGAGGTTADQIGEVLHLGGKPEETAPAQGALQQLLNQVQSNGKIQLAIANSIWPEQSYPFRQDYLNLLDKYFKVSVSPCDFQGQPDAERIRINRWVEQQTNDRIKDLMPEGSIKPMTRLVLANAVYFKGNWERQFKTGATTNADFSVSPVSQVKVPFMTQKASFRYAKPPGLQVLAMPYDGGELSMVVLLPEAKDGLSGLESGLSAEKLQEWIGRLQTTEVEVQFPKFKAESSFNLNRPMQALGMTDAFVSGRANFSGMTDRNDLFISDAVHKAFIEVNEEGTEAAAATGIAVRLTSIQPMPTVFRADHPFLYLIRHEATGTILFMGRMMDPSK